MGRGGGGCRRIIKCNRDLWTVTLVVVFSEGYCLNWDSNLFLGRLLFELGFKPFSQKFTIWTWIQTCFFLRRLLLELGFKPVFSQKVTIWTWIQTCFFSEGSYLNLDSNLFFPRRLLSELGFKPFFSQKVPIWTWIQTCFFSEGYYLNLDPNLFFPRRLLFEFGFKPVFCQVTIWTSIQTCFFSGYYLTLDSNLFFSQKVPIWTWIQTCILMMLKPCYCDLAMLPPPDVIPWFIQITQFCLFKNSFSLCRWDLETMTKNNTISRALNNGWCDCFWAKCMFVCLLKTGKKKKKKKKFFF